MSEQFVFPVYVRFKHLSITDEHVPSRKDKDFEGKRDSVIHVTLDELAEFMQDQSIVDWETVLLRLTSNDLRHIMSMRILGMIIGSIPGVTLANKVEFLEECFGMRITQKDAQKGMERIRQRARIELFRPRVFERYVDFHQHASLSPELRKLLEENSTWDELEQYVHTELLSANKNHSLLTGMKGGKFRELKKMAALTMMYGLVLFHENTILTEHWLHLLGTKVDIGYSMLEETILNELPVYLRAKIQSDTRKTVGNKQNAARDPRTWVIENLRRENQEQKENIKLLLSVIESLSPKRPNEPDPCSTQLHGERILVVGDPGHMPMYRAIVEAYGGEFEFLDGFEKMRQAESKMESADGFLFITAYSSHQKFYAMKAQKQYHKCVLVNQAGLREFEKELNEPVQNLGALVS